MERFDEECNKILKTAEMLAMKSGGIVGTEHLLCAFTYHDNCPATKILARHGVDKSIVKEFLPADGRSYVSCEYSARVRECLNTAVMLSNRVGMRYANSLLLLIATLQDRTSYACQGLMAMGVSPEDIGNDALDVLNGSARKSRPSSTGERQTKENAKNAYSSDEYGESDSEDALAGLGEDMTQKAK
ncbi:MAG: hypothetical protein K2L53_05185, partial [Clostridia bacterium]|nr:hypothetical protein [Clostridia bacterium]